METSSQPRQACLIQPYGGALVDLLVAGDERLELIEQAGRLPAIQISTRAQCDLELLATGAFSPLDRFLGQADYERVLADMRLTSGALLPIPVTLPVEESAAVKLDTEVALRDGKNNLPATM